MSYKKLSDLIGFGKYQDKSIKDVLFEDPSYIQWMLNQEQIRKKILCLPEKQMQIIWDKLDTFHKKEQSRLERWAWLGY